MTDIPYIFDIVSRIGTGKYMGKRMVKLLKIKIPPKRENNIKTEEQIFSVEQNRLPRKT